jgi:hypothetical protein
MNPIDAIRAALIPSRVQQVGQQAIDDEIHALIAAFDFTKWMVGRLDAGARLSSAHGSSLLYCVGLADNPPAPGEKKHMWFDTTLPDIDVDLQDDLRHLTFAHIEATYGKERVARLGTVGTFKARSALQEVGMALKIPKWETDAVADQMIKRSSGDARAQLTIIDTLENMPAGKDMLRDHPEAIIVTRIEGHPKNAGQHAAGVVISNDAIDEIVAVDARTGAAMCDKDDAEGAYGLLKADILGLTQLSVFAETLERAGLPRDYLDHVPYDDKLAFVVINERRYSGVFQFEGGALQSVARAVHIDSFNDFVAMTALARPGPLASGSTNEWINRRTGKDRVTYPHEMLQPYMEETLGVIIYQEQILTIGRAVGDLDWPELTALRKAMSKSLGKEYFDRFGNPWKSAAIRKGMPTQVAEDVWTAMCAYGSYGFNKSHAYSYGLISYWCAHLKARYPLEFLASTLSHTSDPAQQVELLRDLLAEGYDYIPIDPSVSTHRWEVAEREGKKVVVGPLTGVRGIGSVAVQKILSARGAGEPMPARYAKLLEAPKTDIDSLFPIRDAIRRCTPDLREKNIHTPPTMISVLEHMPDNSEVLIIGVLLKINQRDENEEIKIARRGGKRVTDGFLLSLNLNIKDDTGQFFAKVGRFDFDVLGKRILDHGRAGKAIWALKGRLFKRGSFSMLTVRNARLIGDLDE